MSVPSTVASSTPSGTPSGESQSSGVPEAPESENTFQKLTERWSTWTGSPHAHALAKLQPWVTMLLKNFPDGDPDMGAIRGA
eukprot:9942737-Karenia_brevis.AAC.1